MAAILSRPQEIRRDRPLTDDELHRVAPSIFAEEAHESRSDRYLYIPTINVITGLRRAGFEPFYAAQSGTRTAGKREYTKHMLRLRPSNSGSLQNDANEIILVNSHDGTSSYKMLAGMFRFVCANGMIIGDTQSEFTIRHQGDVQGQVIEGAYTVVENFEKLDYRKEIMRAAELTHEEQYAFARAALALKYDGEKHKSPIRPEQILMPRRMEDKGSDMWATFNRVQENMTKGGLRGRAASGRRTQTRPITNIDNNVNLNRSLWVLGEELAKYKVGEPSNVPEFA